MSEMKQVYVVEASTGEYSDHREWPLCAYEHEDEAKAHVVAAQTWARANPYDPNMQIDYTGVRYRYYAVDVYPSHGAFARRSSR